jgi:hypothetical protein
LPSPASPQTPGSVSTSNNPNATPPIRSPGSEATSGRGVGGGGGGTNAELDRKSREIDREIKRGICTGC